MKIQVLELKKLKKIKKNKKIKKIKLKQAQNSPGDTGPAPLLASPGTLLGCHHNDSYVFESSEKL